MQEKNRMTMEQLMLHLQDERDNGYPSFRNEIAQVLHESYNIEPQKAQQIVWNDFFGREITEDIEWSQHMGPNYWAKFIIKNYNNPSPKGKRRLILQH